jgi:hypothetical protein
MILRGKNRKTSHTTAVISALAIAPFAKAVQ